MNILGVSGSLRAGSKNTTLVRAAASLLPAGVTMTFYQGMEGLPHFNPDLDDLDHGKAPAPVLDWRAQLQVSSGLFICSPEYAHGIPGVMKNALDWLVGSGELTEKPTVVFNATPGSTHAHAALVEVLRIMGAVVIEAGLTTPLGGQRFDETQLATNPLSAAPLRSAL